MKKIILLSIVTVSLGACKSKQAVVVETEQPKKDTLPVFDLVEEEKAPDLEVQFVDSLGNDLIKVVAREGSRSGSRSIDINVFKSGNYKVVFRDKNTGIDYTPTYFKMIAIPPDGEKPYQYEIAGDTILPAYVYGFYAGYKISLVGVTVKGPDGKTYTSPVGYTINIV